MYMYLQESYPSLDKQSFLQHPFRHTTLSVIVDFDWSRLPTLWLVLRHNFLSNYQTHEYSVSARIAPRDELVDKFIPLFQQTTTTSFNSSGSSLRANHMNYVQT